jgi:hypothetical protein
MVVVVVVAGHDILLSWPVAPSQPSEAAGVPATGGGTGPQALPFQWPGKKEGLVSLSLILLIILVLLLVGALPTWGYSRSWGYAPSGLLTLVVVVVIVLALMGRLPF